MARAIITGLAIGGLGVAVLVVLGDEYKTIILEHPWLAALNIVAALLLAGVFGVLWYFEEDPD